jgi:dihydrodipicolinate synthase/N-acetylneuraminate lyase
LRGAVEAPPPPFSAPIPEEDDVDDEATVRGVDFLAQAGASAALLAAGTCVEFSERGYIDFFASL